MDLNHGGKLQVSGFHDLYTIDGEPTRTGTVDIIRCIQFRQEQMSSKHGIIKIVYTTKVHIARPKKVSFVEDVTNVYTQMVLDVGITSKVSLEQR